MVSPRTGLFYAAVRRVAARHLSTDYCVSIISDYSINQT